MRRAYSLTLCALTGALAFGCGGKDKASGDAGDPCDASLRPIVFVHGFFASGDTFANHIQRFASNGHCEERIFEFNWDTSTMQAGGATGGANANVAQAVPKLAAFVDEVLASTRADQIDLGGHSQGGQLSMTYLGDPASTGKVAHYAHYGSFALTSGAPGGVPTINVWSQGDTIAANGGGFTGVTDVELVDQDHNQTATSPESFAATYEHFHDGQTPKTTEILPESKIMVSGLALGFGDNVPSPGGTIDVWEVDATTAERLSAAPVATFSGDGKGTWGPFQAKPGAHYEIHATNDQGQIHIYREPFVRSNPVLYVRSMPATGTLTYMMLNSYKMTPANFTDTEARLMFNTSGQSLRYGRDTLTVDGENVATADVADPAQTTLAIFFNDGNGNGTSDLTKTAGLIPLPFLVGFDQVFPVEPPRAIPVIFDGRSVAVRNWKAKSEGVSVAVFQ